MPRVFQPSDGQNLKLDMPLVTTGLLRRGKTASRKVLKGQCKLETRVGKKETKKTLILAPQDTQLRSLDIRSIYKGGGGEEGK